MPRGKRRDLSAQFPHANADINGGAGDGSAEVDADAAAAVNELMATAGYYVPTVAASDVSTSGDEDDEAWITSQEGAAEGSTAGGVASSFDASNAHNSLFMDSENSDEDEDEEEEGGPGGSSFGGAASSGAKSKREATCRWEDCGEAFMELTKFIDHLHRSKWFLEQSAAISPTNIRSHQGREPSPLRQLMLDILDQNIHANGQDVPGEANRKHLGLRSCPI